VERVAPGELLCALAERAPRDLLQRLTDFLESETGHQWDIRITDATTETAREASEREERAIIERAGNLPEIAAALAALPGAEIVKVEDIQTLEDEDKSDNVIAMNTRKRG
jgi:hypothetical protein